MANAIVLLKDHGYKMEKKKALKMIENLIKEFKGSNVILAIEKDNVFEMRNDRFNCAYDLLTATQDWIKRGYKVYYARCMM